MPDATFHGYLLAFLSTLLQNQAIYPSLFVTHGSSLPLGNALCGFRHKQDTPTFLCFSFRPVVGEDDFDGFEDDLQVHAD